MADQAASIARALNGVTTAGAARGAIGAALNALHGAYDLLGRLPDDLAAAGKHELDIARTALEGWYRQIQSVAAAASFKNDFAGKRKLIESAYSAVAGVEGAAGYTPQTSNLAILQQSIIEAPEVFGKAAGEVAKSVGSVAGSTVGGVVSGLGVSGTVTLLVVGAIVLLIFTRGTILGRAVRLIGGGG